MAGGALTGGAEDAARMAKPQQCSAAPKASTRMSLDLNREWLRVAGRVCREMEDEFKDRQYSLERKTVQLEWQFQGSETPVPVMKH
jgi:hypothetical protein